jgi:hypothetical protein
MKTSLNGLKAPIGIIVFLLILLAILLFLPDPLKLNQPSPVVHTAPLILRHTPAPVVHHVRDVRRPTARM